MPDPQAHPRHVAARVPAALRWVLFGLIVFRVAYHMSYVGEDPFALGTFSDGRIYEEAGYNILWHPPLGTQPFYLQGIYAYFMAVGFAIYGWVGVVLLAQLLLAAVTAWVLWRALKRALPPLEAGLSMAIYLASPGIMFYENKFLSAQMGVTAMVLTLAAVVGFVQRPGLGRAVAVGAAVGLCVLARPNLLLAAPAVGFVVLASVPGATPHGRTRLLAAGLFGLIVALAPMAIRNAVVTGSPTVFPAHGGGTSFYIGNNPHARGVWNNAGGVVTATVTEERDDLADRLNLGDGPDLEGAIGRELYGRAFAFARDEPGAFAWLQVRKLFLTLGNDELTQDYDWQGEQELLGSAAARGVPFGLALGLGFLGAIALWRRREEPTVAALLWTTLALLLAVLAANVVYFTSAQHRMPLSVCLAVLAGPGLVAAWRRRLAWSVLAVGAALALQGFWPRSRKDAPSAVHYYNMAVVQTEVGLIGPALATMERALQVRPDHPLIRLEHARLLWATDDLDGAEAELDRLDALDSPPSRVRDQAWRLRRAIKADREDLAKQGGRP